MDEEKTLKKKQLILMGIGLAFLLVLVIGATYAYFTFTSDNQFKDPATIEGSMGELGAGVSLTRAEDSTLTLNLSAADMLLENAGTYYASGSETPKTIATVKVAGGGIFNCTYTLEVTKTATSTEADMYDRFQNGYTNKSEGQVWFTINDVVYDFNTANLFGENGKLTYQGTLSFVSSEEDIELTANMIISNSSSIDQTYLNGTDVSLSINATEFNCDLINTNNLAERIMTLRGNGQIEQINSTVQQYEIVEVDSYQVFINSDAYATEGEDATDAYSYGNGIWRDSNLVDDGSIYHLKIDIPSSGDYNLCYSILNSNENSTMVDFMLLKNGIDLLNGNAIQINPYVSSCTPLGNLNIGDYIQIPHIVSYPNDSEISFYIEKQVESSNYSGFRYQGAEVNNYLEFNNEIWRIIGIEDGEVLGLENGKYYTKIIKEDSIGDLAYDMDGNHENNWSTTSLYGVLNEDYYNRVNDYANTGLTEESKNLLVNVNWYYNSISMEAFPYYDYNIPYGFMANDFYAKERKEADKVVNNLVGLISPSDFSYAASSECQLSITDQNGYTTNENCLATNWLYRADEVQWTILPTGYFGSAWVTGFETDVVSIITSTNAVHPSVYLDTDVIITGGNGSESSPYTISKPTA